MTVCFATQDTHVSGSWEQVVNAGKLRYIGLVSTHMTHSFICTSGRLRFPVTAGGFGVADDAFAAFLLAMTEDEVREVWEAIWVKEGAK
jgi:hypothetical protein